MEKLSSMKLVGGASGKGPTCQCRRFKGGGLIPGLGRSLGGGARQPTPVFLPGKSQGQRSLVGYSPEGCKESITTEVAKYAHTHAKDGFAGEELLSPVSRLYRFRAPDR